MKIGDIYSRGGLKGVIVYVDDSGAHGLIISLDEAFLNWHESDKWCQKLGDGWFMPSVNEFESMRNNGNLKKIQNALIRVGIPLCFGDEINIGTNKGGHMYWTRDLQQHNAFGSFMWVFCLYYNGFSQMSSENKEESQSCYCRAMHRF